MVIIVQDAVLVPS